MTSKELDIEFQVAVDRINSHTEPFPADVLLKLYAYYKKATKLDKINLGKIRTKESIHFRKCSP